MKTYLEILEEIFNEERVEKLALDPKIIEMAKNQLLKMKRVSPAFLSRKLNVNLECAKKIINYLEDQCFVDKTGNLVEDLVDAT